MTATLGSQGARSADTDPTLADAVSSTPQLLSDAATSTPVDPGAFTEGSLGKRAFAHAADVLIALMVVLGVGAIVGQSGDVAKLSGFEKASDYCSAVSLRSDVATCVSIPDWSPMFGNWAVVWSATDLVIMGVAAFVFWMLVMVLLQGRTGATPGKMFAGLSVVDQQGNLCGTSRALTRSLLWIVDSLPIIAVGWIVPVVGILAAVTNTGHRRVGDLVAGTWVVPTDRIPDIMAAAAAVPVAATPEPKPVVAPEPEPQPAVTPEPTPEPETRPLSRIARDAFSEESDPLAAFKPEPEPTPESEPAPALEPRRTPRSVIEAETTPTPESAPQPREQTPVPTYEPQWDAARNAYICWEPVRGQWLQHDTATGAWRPIS